MPHHLKVVLIEISNQCAHVEWIVDTTGKVDEMNRNNFDVNFVPGNCKVARQTRMFGLYGKLILFFAASPLNMRARSHDMTHQSEEFLIQFLDIQD